MGYCSNVTVALYTREPHAARAAFIQAWASENGLLDDWFKDGARVVENRGLVFEFDNVKWDAMFYDDVGKFMAAYRTFMNEICDSGDDCGEYACELIRVGEDDSDIERITSNYNDWVLCVSRSILCEF